MGGSVLSFLKAEWKVSDTGSVTVGLLIEIIKLNFFLIKICCK
jgi:hypothetical protein